MSTSPATLDLLKRVSTATITGQLLKQHGMRSRAIRAVRPLNASVCRFVGPAYTVRYVPMREDLEARANLGDPENPLRLAIENMPAGAVMVIDMGGTGDGGALGDILVARLIARGVAGVVADGAMRDVGQLARMNLPVFCRGAAPPPSFAGLIVADTQSVIGCGGAVVFPGDVVAADEDGVVVIPREHADVIARDGVEQEAMETWIRSRVEAGAAIPGLYPPNEATRAEYQRTKSQSADDA